MQILKRSLPAILALALLAAGCQAPAREEEPASQPPRSQASQPQAPEGSGPSQSSQPAQSPAEGPDFDFASPGESYLFFTAGAPEEPFLLSTGDQFAGWTGEIAWAGGDGQGQVNLRAGFSGSVPLSGDVVLYEDRLSGSTGLWFEPDEASREKIPRFWGDDPEMLYTLELAGITPEELREALGEPRTRERDLGGGEILEEEVYSGCAILGENLSIRLGLGPDGSQALGYAYLLTASLDSGG